jgi:lipopolysaccharide export system permease protein
LRILFKYISIYYLRIFTLCIGAFVSIYLIIDILEKLRSFTRAHAEFEYIFYFFLCKIPGMVTQVVPLATLMATLLTLGGLSRANEITAMRSCGVSLGKISFPIITIAIITSMATLFANEVLTPASYANMQYIEQVKIKKKNPNIFFRQQNIWYRDEGYILEASLFDPDIMTLKGITLWKLGPGIQPVKRIEAEQGVLNKGGWLFKNVVMRTITKGATIRTDIIPRMEVPLALKIDDLKVLEKGTDNMGILALNSYCDKLSRGGYDATRYLAQMHSRISLPFASLVMAFLGIPFALRGGRTSGIALGISISMGVGFAYFVINSTLLSFGQAGVLSPAISAWAANSIFASMGIWLAMTMNR